MNTLLLRTNAILCVLLAVFLAGCGTGASFNDPLDPIATIQPAAGPEPAPIGTASNPRDLCGFEYPDPGPHFVGLTLSGGGARAAVFSAAVIFELSDLGLMRGVDVMSGASGGSVAAAYYAVTCDDPEGGQCSRALDPTRETARRTWQRDEVYERLSRDFIIRSLGSRFLPGNLARTTFNAYDNTDIFAAVLSDNLYDSPIIGTDFVYSDLHPARPLLVINATNATGAPSNGSADLAEADQRLTFTFTKWGFERLQSDLCSFEVGRAVAASSAYPAFFNYATLARYKFEVDGSASNAGYVHLFDAGASDNLAIDGLLDAMRHLEVHGPEHGKFAVPTSARATVFVVDAQNGFHLRSPEKSDLRTPLDHIVDRNFMDVYDTLMAKNYGFTLRNLNDSLIKRGFTAAEERTVFHLALKGLDPNWPGYENARGAAAFHTPAQHDTVTAEERLALLQEINGIKTTYGLEEDEVRCLAASAHVLMNDLRPKLEEVFGELPAISEPDRARFRNDLDHCLSQGARRTEIAAR